jgi:hypothetical protein
VRTRSRPRALVRRGEVFRPEHPEWGRLMIRTAPRCRAAPRSIRRGDIAGRAISWTTMYSRQRGGFLASSRLAEVAGVAAAGTPLDLHAANAPDRHRAHHPRLPLLDRWWNRQPQLRSLPAAQQVQPQGRIDADVEVLDVLVNDIDLDAPRLQVYASGTRCGPSPAPAPLCASRGRTLRPEAMSPA